MKQQTNCKWCGGKGEWKQTQTMQERFDEIYENQTIIGDRTFKDYLPNMYKSLKDFINQEITLAVQQERVATEKAFGGCKKCYGKGYATFSHNYVQHADFIGDKTSITKANPMVFCDCDRGKQLSNLINNQS